jgi:hypothetical protein
MASPGLSFMELVLRSHRKTFQDRIKKDDYMDRTCSMHEQQ